MRIIKLKRSFISFWIAILIFTQAKAQQNWDTLPWKSYSDFKLQNLNKSYVITNILYDRMFPLANVDEYTGLPKTNNDTTHPDHLMQAYYEIYNSSYNTTGWISPDSLDALIKSNGNSRQHPIGIFYYKFNTLDTNALQDHLVDTLANGQFVDVPDRPRSPYFNDTSFLAAPLLADGQVVEEGVHEFYIDPQFFLHNEYLNIQSVSIDFGDGQPAWTVYNPFSGGNGVNGWVGSILKSLGNTILGRIVVVGVDILGRTIRYGSPFKLFVKNTKQYQPLTFCKGGGQKWVIEAPQSRLDPINTQYGNPQLEYKNADGQPVKDTAYFYFAGNGSSCDINVLHKPVIFIDGFDPTNSRTVQKIYEDYINVNVVRNSQQVKFGDYMLSEGYDFVILDFKHGNDLLERNAMTLVSLIERLNQTYGSTMQQGITLIGPSMGSLIAQYALAYMEKNNIPHNVKTYISFDGCHQGANVPIGLQNFVEYFTRKGIFKKNKAIRDGLYNGLGARQQLAHHVSANSQFPAPDALRTKFLQNLAAVNEYPQLCRKVALINGANTGTLNPNQSACSTLLRIYTQRKGWKSIWGLCQDKICMKLDWECKTTPNTVTAKVMDNWTVEPLFNLLFWAPLGRKNVYADAAWGNSAQDDAPGGTFGTFFGSNPGDINESNFVFLLKETMYLLTGSKRTNFTQHINDFTMMPSYSAADLRFANKNLYSRFDNICPPTPFDHIYAPAENQRHVSVSAQGSQWFENEVRGILPPCDNCNNFSIAGNQLICNSEDYEIPGLPNTASVVWSIPQSAGPVLQLSQNTPSLNKLRITNQRWYGISTILTATISNPPGCSGGQITLTKNIANDNATNPNTVYDYTQESCTFYNVYHPSQSGTITSNSSPVFVHQGCMVYVNLGNISGNVTLAAGSGQPLFWSVGTTSYYQNTLYFQLPLGSGGVPFVFNISGNGACFNKSLLFFSYPNNNVRYVFAAVPNPVKNILAITAKENEDLPLHMKTKTTKENLQFTMNIYDVNTNTLQITQQSKRGSLQHQLNTSRLKTGYYVLQIIEGDQKQSFKFFKE